MDIDSLTHAPSTLKEIRKTIMEANSNQCRGEKVCSVTHVMSPRYYFFRRPPDRRPESVSLDDVEDGFHQFVGSTGVSV